jgi:hypothetical protein
MYLEVYCTKYLILLLHTFLVLRQVRERRDLLPKYTVLSTYILKDTALVYL